MIWIYVARVGAALTFFGWPRKKIGSRSLLFFLSLFCSLLPSSALFLSEKWFVKQNVITWDSALGKVVASFAALLLSDWWPSILLYTVAVKPYSRLALAFAALDPNQRLFPPSAVILFLSVHSFFRVFPQAHSIFARMFGFLQILISCALGSLAFFFIASCHTASSCSLAIMRHCMKPPEAKPFRE